MKFCISTLSYPPYKSPNLPTAATIRQSNPEAQTLTLRFLRRKLVNHPQSEAIKQLRNQGGEA
ncbi:hypothetical protein RHMOL_Rhmol02G0181400 [Rhododendron molle]|uniref:Uncharacterized protein n=1 Tax=Rhododendron molle TaxID=49168 RepID=A0ACC0PR49_RHOML|nr:hypothetical protein RHMOL_Rhmol02G0181400 [Rhododendron molle]